MNHRVTGTQSKTNRLPYLVSVVLPFVRSAGRSLVRREAFSGPVTVKSTISVSLRLGGYFSLCALVISVGSVASAPAPLLAQKMTGSPAGAGYRSEPGQAASTLPAPLREIGFDQNLNQRIPLDTMFKDETGRTVRLGDYFGTRPVVLLFAYYDCPMLCTQVISGLASALDVLSLTPGKDFEIVTVSFDPRDTPAAASAKKVHFIERYKKPGAAAAWHFLTGDPPAIARLTKAAGFRYVWDEPTKQFAHPSGVIVLTPDGRLARYLFGIEYGPRDLRFGIVEASEGRVGNPADALLLYCFHYDPMTGRYGLVIMRVIRLAGIATVLALAGFITVMLRRERRSALRPSAASASNGLAPDGSHARGAVR